MASSIDRLFHTTHCVDDTDEANIWLQRVFGRTSRLAGYSAHAKRTAIFTTIGDVNFESITSNPNEPSPILRFYSRYGAHLHSIAWYVTGIGEVTERLRDRGVRLFGEGGAPVQDRPTSSGGMDNDFWAIFTHPRDSYGMLEFAEMSPAFAAARAAREQESGASILVSPDGQDPLGIEKHRSHTVVVENLDEATKFLIEALGAEVFLEEENRLFQTASRYLRVGSASTIELAQPLQQATPAGADLEKCGGIFHALVFKVRDLSTAIAHLKAQGVRFEMQTETAVLTDPSTSLGARFGFSSEYALNDARAER